MEQIALTLPHVTPTCCHADGAIATPHAQTMEVKRWLVLKVSDSRPAFVGHANPNDINLVTPGGCAATTDQ